MSAQDLIELCPICGSSVELKSNRLPSYNQNGIYNVFYCYSCNTSYTWPRIPDNNLYEQIYKNAGRVIGYNRYIEYAEQVLQHSDPLGYLAREDVYWSIESTLKRYAVEGQTQILDFGSGLGYLTYAIHKRGYNVTGLDISQNAVTSARNRYGNHFVCADLYEYAKSNQAKYDIVILAEVIEHIPDPLPFLATVSTLIRPNGRLIITTPNKSITQDDVLWDTDLPPVHFWWFSEESLNFIGKHLGLKVEYVDFTLYNERWKTGFPGKQIDSDLHHPVFDLEGNILVNPKVARFGTIKKIIKWLGLMGVVKRYRQQLSKIRYTLFSSQWDKKRSYTISTVLQRDTKM